MSQELILAGKTLRLWWLFFLQKFAFLLILFSQLKNKCFIFYFFPEGFSFLSNLKYLQSIPVHRGFTWLYYAKLLFNMKQKKKHFNQLPRHFVENSQKIFSHRNSFPRLFLPLLWFTCYNIKHLRRSCICEVMHSWCSLV